jgi:hypothetical protein
VQITRSRKPIPTVSNATGPHPPSARIRYPPLSRKEENHRPDAASSWRFSRRAYLRAGVAIGFDLNHDPSPFFVLMIDARGLLHRLTMAKGRAPCGRLRVRLFLFTHRWGTNGLIHSMPRKNCWTFSKITSVVE